MVGSGQTRAARGEELELRDWWYGLQGSFPRPPHMPSLPCKNKVRKFYKKVVFHFPEVVCCITCPQAIIGPSNGAALVSLERDVDVESLYVDIIY